MSDNVFFSAVEAHINWKLRLQKHLDGTSEEVLNPKVICLDNQCVLGKWIYGEGQKYSELPDFEPLRDVHASFHKCASEVVENMDEGNKEQAQEIFGGKYAELSKNITRMLVRMDAKLKNRR